VYFKGFHKVRNQWNEEAWEERCSAVLGEAMDDCIEASLEMADQFPARFRRDVLEDAIEDLRDVERTFRYLKSRDLSSDDIEFILLETMDYYSDRHINNEGRWLDEPPKPWVTRYPTLNGSKRQGKRTRAYTDDWFTVNFVVLI
jgi:hypothetical protein